MEVLRVLLTVNTSALSPVASRSHFSEIAKCRAFDTTSLNLCSALESGRASSFRSRRFMTCFAAASRRWAGDFLDAHCLREERVVLRAFDRAAAEFIRWADWRFVAQHFCMM